MLRRSTGLALAFALTGCATTLSAEDVARAQQMNQFSMDMTMQAMQSAQLANDLAMQATNNAMLLNAINLANMPPPMPPP